MANTQKFDYAYCPNCECAASTEDDVQKFFGVRTMTQTGERRVQSWCRICRRASYYASKGKNQ
jgi:hypothetical protein